jgi:hypothetical protein
MINGKANKVHTHTTSDITNLSSTLNNYALKSDLTEYDDTTLKDMIDGKANKVHTHTTSDITNLSSTLNNYALKSDLNFGDDGTIHDAVNAIMTAIENMPDEVLSDYVLKESLPEILSPYLLQENTEFDENSVLAYQSIYDTSNASITLRSRDDLTRAPGDEPDNPLPEKESNSTTLIDYSHLSTKRIQTEEIKLTTSDGVINVANQLAYTLSIAQSGVTAGMNAQSAAESAQTSGNAALTKANTKRALE